MEEGCNYHQVVTKGRDIKIVIRKLEETLLNDSVTVSENLVRELKNAGPAKVREFLLKLVNCSEHYETIAKGLTERILEEKFGNLPKDIYNKAYSTLYEVFKEMVSKVLSGVGSRYLMDEVDEDDIKRAVGFFFERITENRIYWPLIATYIRFLFEEFGHDPKVLYR